MPSSSGKPASVAPNIALLAEKLAHQFATPRLLEDALTHPSLSGARPRKKGAPYERLEFLGDRVLG
ncbi:MAG: ribonuclease III, partial [Alphaproteobacteria bacterium]